MDAISLIEPGGDVGEDVVAALRCINYWYSCYVETSSHSSGGTRHRMLPIPPISKNLRDR